jgi:hypothetical protein
LNLTTGPAVSSARQTDTRRHHCPPAVVVRRYRVTMMVAVSFAWNVQ